LSGKYITLQQEYLYMKNRSNGKTQELSAAIAGISIKTGYRIEKGKRKAQCPRSHRTRIDPFEKVWESELVSLLKQEPKLTGLTLWEYLDDNYPGVYPYSKLRTLQRRVKTYNAQFGAAKDVIFRQSFPPGLQGLTDFTHPDTKITIAGVEFKHMIYQFVLAYSGHRYAQIILGGESYSALANGLQNAFHAIGGVPLEHKTDSLSAAFRNSYEEMKLTKNYANLCSHYGIKAIRNTKGISHENGAVETAHGALKHRIDQAIKLRKSNDFASIEKYQQLINKQIKRLNKRSQAKFLEEQKILKSLPKERFMDYQVLSTKVTTTSTILIKTTLYTVPSKLIGENIKVHLYHDKIECFVGNHMIESLVRVYPTAVGLKVRCINYKHVIDSLSKKPQAFRYSSIRDELMPNQDYAKLWIICNEQFDSHMACKWMVTVIKIAAKVADINTFAQSLLLNEKLPVLKTLQDKYLLKEQVVPDIAAIQHQLGDYHAMFTSGQWQTQQTSTGVAQ
jgi:hypothetical protein